MRLSWENMSPLTFESPDEVTFRCLPLARRALEKGGNSPAVLSVANDLAVEAFLSGNIGFLQIADVVEQVLSSVPHGNQSTLDDVLDAVEQAKQAAVRTIKGLRW